jgi:hypothetical protein
LQRAEAVDLVWKHRAVHKGLEVRVDVVVPVLQGRDEGVGNARQADSLNLVIPKGQLDRSRRSRSDRLLTGPKRSRNPAGAEILLV